MAFSVGTGTRICITAQVKMFSISRETANDWIRSAAGTVE